MTRLCTKRISKYYHHNKALYVYSNKVIIYPVKKLKTKLNPVPRFICALSRPRVGSDMTTPLTTVAVPNDLGKSSPQPLISTLSHLMNG